MIFCADASTEGRPLASKKEKAEKLGAVPLFSGLSQKDIGRLVDMSKETVHSAGQSVVTQGKGGVGFHLIVEGQAKVTRGGRVVANLGPGDFFGEMTLIDGAPRSATVTAETDLTTVVLSQWEFRPLVKASPDMAWKLIVHLTGRLREEQKASDAALS
jgi:CRP/FNR family transcriptional regulator, cyclic AMP receptor protein